MLFAMTPMLLILPLLHIADRSFANWRAPLIGLFVAGYLAVWMFAGVPLFLAAQTARATLLGPSELTIACALLWQFSPWKQACLNRCHYRPSLSPLGFGAVRDVVRYGAKNGAWCVGACWPVMLVPMALQRNASTVMVAVALFLATERLEPPAPVVWRVRFPMRAIRILRAKAKVWSAARY